MSPKKSPQDRKQKRTISTAAAWGSGKRNTTTDLELPSGHIVRIKRVDLPTLLASGAFPDSLMAIVSDKIDTATGQKDSPKAIDPELVAGMIKDPKKLEELFTAMDKIVPLVVEEPVVAYHKRPAHPDTAEWEVIPDEDREEGVAYTDTIDLEDKTHIFQFAVGGTRDVETFRGELGAAVESLSAE